jgi:hypothetical protein
MINAMVETSDLTGLCHQTIEDLLCLLSSKYYTQRNGKDSLLGVDLVIFQKLVGHPGLSRLS